jgi:hypothetical protein
MTQNLNIAIDNESVNIFRETEEEPVHICYWYFEEWEEDPTIVPSILKAVELYYTNQQLLLETLGLYDLIIY